MVLTTLPSKSSFFPETQMNRKLLLFVAAAIVITASMAGRPLLTTSWSQPPAQEKPQVVKIDPRIFDQYAGQYALNANPDFIFSFFREGDRYFLQPTNQE